MSELIGTWQKQGSAACAASYPATLTILPGGQYRGTAATPGDYAVWDVGTWKEQAPGLVDISTANDAVIQYRYRRAGRELHFEDQQGCKICYGAVQD